MKRVSLKDIAENAGVSPSTVSFVLNGKAKEMRIRQSVAEKIIAVANSKGYSPNNIAVSLRTGQSKIIGLIIEDISNSFFATLAKIIEKEVNLLGYKVVYCSTENDSKKGSELIKMLYDSRVDGLLITPSKGIKKDIESFLAYNIPAVLMDRHFPDLALSSVVVQNAQGVKDGMDHLFRKGYRRIGFVTVDIEQMQMQEREEGYRSFFNEMALSFDEDLILKLPYNYKNNLAIEEIKMLIKTRNLDAIFFATNYLGIMGIESILQLQLTIPGDIAMICFDDHDLFRLYPPGITCIEQPVSEIGLASVHLLMTQLRDKKNIYVETHLELPVKLIVRGST